MCSFAIIITMVAGWTYGLRVAAPILFIGAFIAIILLVVVPNDNDTKNTVTIPEGSSYVVANYEFTTTYTSVTSTQRNSLIDDLISDIEEIEDIGNNNIKSITVLIRFHLEQLTVRVLGEIGNVTILDDVIRAQVAPTLEYQPWIDNVTFISTRMYNSDGLVTPSWSSSTYPGSGD